MLDNFGFSKTSQITYNVTPTAVAQSSALPRPINLCGFEVIQSVAFDTVMDAIDWGRFHSWCKIYHSSVGSCRTLLCILDLIAALNEYMMTSSNGNIFRVTGHLCGEFTVPGEFPAQRPVTRGFDVSLICTRINGWVNKGEAGDLRRHRAHCDVTVIRNITANVNFKPSGYDCFDWYTRFILWYIPTIKHMACCVWLWFGTDRFPAYSWGLIDLHQHHTIN